jgi:hypothetical protein
MDHLLPYGDVNRILPPSESVHNSKLLPIFNAPVNVPPVNGRAY